MIEQRGELLTIPIDDELISRQLTIQDAPAFYGTFENCRAHVEQANFFDQFPDLDTFAALVEASSINEIMMGIWKTDGTPVGLQTLQGFVGNDEGVVTEVSIGYCIAEKYTRNGFGGRSTKATVDFLFEVLGMEKVGAIIKVGNFPSAAVAYKSGLRFAGTELNRDGNNCWLFEKTSDGFDASQSIQTDDFYQEYSYSDPRKKWISVGGIDEVRTLEVNAKLHVCDGGSLIAMQGDRIQQATFGQSILVAADIPYQLLGPASFYQIPQDHAVASAA